MGDRRHIGDISNFEAGRIQRTNRRLAPRTRSLYAHFEVFMPNSCTMALTFSAATCAAKGVLLREPRKPEPPAVAQASAFPWRSVIVTIVLLNDAWMWAIPSTTFFLTFFRVRAAVALAIS